MKRKKTNWQHVKWTPFQQVPNNPTDHDKPVLTMINSRYQVTAYRVDGGPVFGDIAWLSIKTHDRQAHHDWRDLQRIKNEIIGEEFDAVEIYPKESKLIDTANQYHLWVFLTGYTLPFGFNEGRLVGDGNWNGSVQRPFRHGTRPVDCIGAAEYDAMVSAKMAQRRAQQAGTNDENDQ